MYRPKSVTVLGILNIVFGSLGILGTIISAVILFAVRFPRGSFQRLMMNSEAYSAFMMISLPLGLLASVLLLVAGIGLLGLKPWARVCSIVYSIYAIVAGIVGVIVTIAVVTGPAMHSAYRYSRAAGAGAVGGAIGGIVGGIIGLAYPIILLIFMCRRNVIDAFQNRGYGQLAGPGPAGRFPPYPPPPPRQF